MALSALSITIHRVFDLPEKVGRLHRTTSPNVMVYMMKDKYNTQTVPMSGNEAIFEETWTTAWDGTSSLAIDLHSRDHCFAKLWIKLRDILDANGRWTGTMEMKPEKANPNPPKMVFTVVNTGTADLPPGGGDQTAVPLPGEIGGPGFFEPGNNTNGNVAVPLPADLPPYGGGGPAFPDVGPPVQPQPPVPFPGDPNYPPCCPPPGGDYGYGGGYPQQPPPPPYYGVPYGQHHREAGGNEGGDDVDNLTAF